MKKTVLVNGVPRKVEFEYHTTGELLQHSIGKKWDKQVGWVAIETNYHKAVATIDGVEYPGIRRWHTEGGRYTEEYFYNGHFYKSHKKMIERILELANGGEVDLPP